MFFMKKINVHPFLWKICNHCIWIKPYETLCIVCINNRDSYINNQISLVKNSYEYRFRNWLSKLFKPKVKYKKI